MKKRLLAVTAAALSLSGAAYGAEFQPIGTLGIGGAGVARQNGAFTAYWNPAGGAFNDKSFSFMTGAEFGIRGSDGLTENVDKLSKIKFDNLKNLGSTSANPETVADAVKVIGILKDISQRDGNLAISAGVPVGFTIKHLSFGVYGNMEGYVQPMTDSTNILPTQTSGGSVSITAANLLTAVQGTADPGNNAFFNTTQYTTLVNNLKLGGLTDAQAGLVVNVLEQQLKLTGQDPNSMFTSFAQLSGDLATGSTPTNTIDKNTTSVMTKALLYAEVPIAYGHPIDLGRFGKIGVGFAIKPIAGVVYQNQVLLVNNTSGNVKSGDLIKEITKNKKESNSIGIDAGVLWKKSILSVGVVAKNLNSPKFSGPDYQAPADNDPTHKVTIKGKDVTLDPMVRAGVALDPWKWLTIAADMDITKNSSVVPNQAVKSQNVGGGLEIHPWSILKLRVGALKNIAESGNPLIATAGFSLGPLDLDAATSTKTFKVGSNTIPDEVKVQLMLGFTF